MLAVRAIPFFPLGPTLLFKFTCDELRERDVSVLRLPFDTDIPNPSRPFAPGRGEPGVGVKDDAVPSASDSARPSCGVVWGKELERMGDARAVDRRFWLEDVPASLIRRLAGLELVPRVDEIFCVIC